MTKFATPEDLFLDQVKAEIEAARTKFPTNEDRLAALHEESGEVASALLGVKYGTHTWADVFKEAVQLAAMSARLALEGDAGIAVPESLDLVRRPGFEDVVFPVVSLPAPPPSSHD